MESFDALIIGAGAAGLAAAASLAAHGRTVCVLEARSRVGGRILTRRRPEVAVPIELGAEFVHGRAPETVEWLARTKTAVVAADGGRHWHRRGELWQPSDAAFAAVEQGIEKLAPPDPDVSFADFLAGPASRVLPPEARDLATLLVEGFDAADPSRASAREVLAEWTGESAADAGTGRPAGGYEALLEALSGALAPSRVQLLLDAPVRVVRFRRGRVRVEADRYGEPLRLEAARAVVTLPLGALKSGPGTPGAVLFEPELAEKREALEHLDLGPAIKVVMCFRHALWRTAHDRLGNDRVDRVAQHRFEDAAFFHSPDAPFPTFWTAWPAEAPVLTAWAAGPRASRLAGAGRDEIVKAALASLERLFGSRPSWRNALAAVDWHDWSADPYAGGAYSYVTVGGSQARRMLAAPLEDTLFFAGEAACPGAHASTVEGALASGARAAAELLAASAAPA